MTQPSTKKLLQLFTVIFITLSNFQAVYSQSYILTSSSGSFTPLSGTPTLAADIQNDDGLSTTIPIGFTFNFLGVNYTNLKAAADGYLTFNLLRTESLYDNVISTGADSIIAPLWDNLDGSVGTASYKVSGTAGSRTFTFEWLNWKWTSLALGENISFQVNLHETTNVIEFIYRPESNLLSLAGASIGLVGNNDAQFYSLLNSTSSAKLDLDGNGNDLINIKPANGQVYTFTPTPAATPVTQATSITSSPSAASLSLGWTNGSGSYRAVFVKQTSSTSETVPVVDGTKYKGALNFGDSPIGSGWSCVYNGTGTAVNVTGLQSGLTYRIQVVEYNGIATAQKYLTTTNANNPINSTTVLSAPTSPASTLSLISKIDTQAQIDLIEGNGTSRAIFIKATNMGTSNPVNNTTYTANTIFQSGSQIGSSGWYCVFNGSASSGVTVTGLTASTDYSVHVVDYNGIPGNEKYFITSVTNNPIQFTTAAASGLLNQTITFGALPAVTYGDAPITLTATASSGLPVSYASSNTAVATVSGNTVTIVGGGTATITASQAGNGSYNPAPNVGQMLVVNKAAQTISFSAFPAKNFGDAAFGLTATASSTLPVSYTSSNTSIATVSGTTVTIVGAGSTTITASQAGNGNFNAASSVGQLLTINKANQTITFNTLPSKATNDGSFILDASASSGLPITYTSSVLTVATVSGSTVTIVGNVGTTDIKASQSGNANYNAASDVIRVLTVKVKADQTITFGDITSKTLGDSPFMLTASATSTLGVTFTSASIPGKITLSGNTVTIVSPGSVTITAVQPGDDNFRAAPSINRTFCINPAKPTISATADFHPVLTSSNASGNQWFKDGVAISGATNKTYAVIESGNYTVTTTVDNCSSVTSEGKALIVTGTETLDYGIKVFPNPTEGTLMVDVSSLPATRPTTISLYDASGKVLQTINAKGLFQLELGTYKAGNYLIQIKNGTKFISKHISKK